MRILVCMLLATLLCGCSGGNSQPSAATGTSQQKLPIEVEKGPEDALPKKASKPR